MTAPGNTIVSRLVHLLFGIALLSAPCIATAASAIDFGAMPSDAHADQWLRDTSATYASLIKEIGARKELRGYRFVTTPSVRRGMVAWVDGYLEVQLNPELAGPSRITTIVFEIANASRHHDHRQVDLAVDKGLIRTAEEFGLAHEMLEYEALRLHRQVLIELDARAGPLPVAFYGFVTPTPPSIREYQLPALYDYLKAQKDSGHTAHYYQLFPRRKPPAAPAGTSAQFLRTTPG